MLHKLKWNQHFNHLKGYFKLSFTLYLIMNTACFYVHLFNSTTLNLNYVLLFFMEKYSLIPILVRTQWLVRFLLLHTYLVCLESKCWFSIAQRRVGIVALWLQQHDAVAKLASSHARVKNCCAWFVKNHLLNICTAIESL